MSESYHASRRSHKTCNHNPAPSGIYAICHIASHRVYIGSAVCMRCRWLHHRRELNRGKHRNNYLQAAWNKYGEDAFCFSEIEECSIDALIEREQYWLNTAECTNPHYGFNLSPTAQSQLGFRHSEASRNRISKAKSNPSEKTRELLRQANLGKKRPDSDCEKISQNHGHAKLSMEQIREIQQRYEDSGHTITQTQLAKEYGVATHTISSIVRRKGRKYQTDIPFSGESTRKMSGMASVSPELRKQSPELIAKRSAGLKGRIVSDATRKKLSEANRGKIGPTRGKKLTEEHKRKISDANRGKRHTPETRLKMSKSQQKLALEKKLRKEQAL